MLAVLSCPVVAAEVLHDVDIPASEESVDDEPVVDIMAIPPEHRLKKRLETPEAVIVPDTANIAEPDNVPVDAPSVPSNVVVLQGLNKVIGRVSTFELPLGIVGKFENLEIIARKCWKAPPSERPENASLLDIRESKNNEEPKQLFLGWMMSSSPGLSGLEHPVYDITVLSCEHRKNLE